MKKKIYSKPDIFKTQLDSEINLVLMSENQTVTEPGPPPCPEGEICFFNPFKFLK